MRQACVEAHAPCEAASKEHGQKQKDWTLQGMRVSKA